MRYLALGDSYTIGEGVAADDRWPAQLAAMLRGRGLDVELQVIAQTGWTTGELAAAITLADPPSDFDLVTLLIGVNNQYRGLPVDAFRDEFGGLLDRSIGFAGGSKSRVIALSIPDWGVTPFAEGRDRAAIAAEIDAFNAAARDAAEDRSIAWVDVTAISRAPHRHSAVVADGLHPSRDQYSAWAEAIFPSALHVLSR